MNIISNSRALHDYEILKKYEAGIELFGHEVKALRSGLGSLQGSYIIIEHNGSINKAELHKAYIPPYQEKNTPETYDPYRVRKLLLNTQEIASIARELESGTRLTIAPISMYNKGRVLKLEIALVRGKKLRDKRDTIKKREAEREIAREWRDR